MTISSLTVTDAIKFMDRQIFKNISRIIELDSKTTTYKFALLRGVIDIIQDNSPYIRLTSDRVHVPLGLLVEKWLLYYYPIIESPTYIPQINGNAKIAFERYFRPVIFYYAHVGGFSAFYNDLTNKGIPDDLKEKFLKLAGCLRDTIINMPMKYIGRSISSEYYSIFKFDKGRIRSSSSTSVDIEFLINNLGEFSLPVAYFDAFRILGSFINGQDSILFKWAEFSVNAASKALSIENVVSEVLKSPITQREISESKKIYRSVLSREGKVYCVWTGRTLAKYDIDHIIPFSVWKNNDLWNLLPSDSRINNQKRDKIPSSQMIQEQSDLIIHYWKLLEKHQPSRFRKEVQVALLGNSGTSEWQKNGIKQVQKSCEYLIESRGFEEWKI